MGEAVPCSLEMRFVRPVFISPRRLHRQISTEFACLAGGYLVCYLSEIFFVLAFFVSQPAFAQRELLIRITPGLQVFNSRYDRSTGKAYTFEVQSLKQRKTPSFGIELQLRINNRWSLLSGVQAGGSGWGYSVTLPSYLRTVQHNRISYATYQFPILMDWSGKNYAISRDGLFLKPHGFAGPSFDWVPLQNAGELSLNGNVLELKETVTVTSTKGLSVGLGAGVTLCKDDKSRLDLSVSYQQGLINLFDVAVDYKLSGQPYQTQILSKGGRS